MKHGERRWTKGKRFEEKSQRTCEVRERVQFLSRLGKRDRPNKKELGKWTDRWSVGNPELTLRERSVSRRTVEDGNQKE